MHVNGENIPIWMHNSQVLTFHAAHYLSTCMREEILYIGISYKHIWTEFVLQKCLTLASKKNLKNEYENAFYIILGQ